MIPLAEVFKGRPHLEQLLKDRPHLRKVNSEAIQTVKISRIR